MEISNLDKLTAELEYWSFVLKFLKEWEELTKWKDYQFVKNKIKKIKQEIRKENNVWRRQKRTIY